MHTVAVADLPTLRSQCRYGSRAVSPSARGLFTWSTARLRLTESLVQLSGRFGLGHQRSPVSGSIRFHAIAHHR
jgi:hypothetical protein